MLILRETATELLDSARPLQWLQGPVNALHEIENDLKILVIDCWYCKMALLHIFFNEPDSSMDNFYSHTLIFCVHALTYWTFIERVSATARTTFREWARQRELCMYVYNLWVRDAHLTQLKPLPPKGGRLSNPKWSRTNCQTLIFTTLGKGRIPRKRG